MKYALTFLILCFAFVSNAQINFGVSVSEGFDKLSRINPTISFPHLGLQAFNRIKTKKFSQSIGINYSPFVIRGKITFTNASGDIIGNSVSLSVMNKINVPIEGWYSFKSADSKNNFGITGGVTMDYFLSQVNYQKGVGHQISGVPIKGFYKVSNNSGNTFYYGGQLGIYSLINSQSNNPLIFNLGYSYSKGFSNRTYNLNSIFLRAIILFGK